MSAEQDDAAAKRAAAAEARRQKILARGTERLSRITVGTPMPTEPVLAPVPPPAQPTEPSTAQAPSTETESLPTTSPEPAQQAGQSASPGAGDGAAVAAASAAANEDDDCRMRAAQRQAEAAMHSLLSQLSAPGAAGSQPAQPQQQQQQQQQQQHPEQAGAPGASGTAHADATLRRRTAGSSAPASTTTPAPAPAFRSPFDDGDDHNANALGTGRRAGGAAAGAGPGSAGSGGGGGAVVRAAGLLAAGPLGLLLGPRLGAAVGRTQRLRLLVALVLAAVLHAGALQPRQLGLPPVLALLVLEMALIGAARAVGGPAGSRMKHSLSAGSLAAAESAAASPPGPPPADWLSLVPGLRPLLDSLSSLAALVSGLWADVAVYLVAAALMGAVQQVVGQGAGGLAGGRG